MEKRETRRRLSPPIQALREDSNSHVRLRAALALEAVKDAAAVEPLIQSLHTDEDANVRGGAAWVLGELGDQRAVETLIKALKDESIHVRLFTAMALAWW
nr:HEAT repeat domain-containing protein [Candidatus Sigynarchaeota archaeon]